MNISTMRKMDFYLGIPLTFICRMLQKTWRLAFPKPKVFPAKVKSILLIELSEMGSMIQLIPVIAKIRKTYPDARLYFVTFASSSAILKVIKNIDDDKIWVLNTRSLPAFITSGFTLLFKLLFTRFDIAFDFELFSRTSSLISFLSGSRIKTGFDNFTAEGLYRGNFLTHPVNYNAHLNICKNFLSMVYALGEPWGDLPHCKQVIPDEDTLLPEINFPTASVEAFRARLHKHFPQLKDYSKLVVLNPNSSEMLPLRRWPMEAFTELSRRLTETGKVAIVITGSPSEKQDAAYLCEQLPGAPLFDLSGFTSMDEVIALYFVADLLITNDSGPAQFSALARMNTIALFGPETPDLYGSLNPNAVNVFKRLHCSPCYTAQNNRTSICKNNVCMQQITVDEVYDHAKRMLNL